MLLSLNVNFQFIFYASESKIKRMVPDFISNGIIPYGIIQGDAVDNESKIQTQCFNVSIPKDLEDITKNDIPIVVCGNYYKQTQEFKDTIEKLNPNLIKRCINDGELYKMLFSTNSFKFKEDCNDTTILIDLQNGFIMGGLEVWATNIYHKLYRNRKNVNMLAINHDTSFYQRVGARFYGINQNCICEVGPYMSDFKCINKIVKILLNKKPSIYIHNGGFEPLVALYIVKIFYLLKITVVSVVHSDHDWFFQYFQPFKEVIDKFVAVNKEINEKLYSCFYERKQDIMIQVQYPELTKNILKDKKYDGTFKIAYASRLNKNTKRSYLLRDLVLLLENNISVPYELHIAGDGECLEELKYFVKEHQLENKVIFYGMLTRYQMEQFWNDKHVYLSLSKLEGNSLSLLEAMTYALVPVVTATGGVEQLITNGKNGFIIQTVDEMSERVQKLSNNRVLCSQMSNESHNAIISSSNLDQELYNYLFKRG